MPSRNSLAQFTEQSRQPKDEKAIRAHTSYCPGNGLLGFSQSTETGEAKAQPHRPLMTSSLPLPPDLLSISPWDLYLPSVHPSTSSHPGSRLLIVLTVFIAQVFIICLLGIGLPGVPPPRGGGWRKQQSRKHKTPPLWACITERE